jgi:hypothetical protein
VTHGETVTVHFTLTPKGRTRPTVDLRKDVTLRGTRPDDTVCGRGPYAAALAYAPAKGLTSVSL